MGRTREIAAGCRGRGGVGDASSYYGCFMSLTIVDSNKRNEL